MLPLLTMLISRKKGETCLIFGSITIIFPGRAEWSCKWIFMTSYSIFMRLNRIFMSVWGQPNEMIGLTTWSFRLAKILTEWSWLVCWPQILFNDWSVDRGSSTSWCNCLGMAAVIRQDSSGHWTHEDTILGVSLFDENKSKTMHIIEKWHVPDVQKKYDGGEQLANSRVQLH